MIDFIKKARKAAMVMLMDMGMALIIMFVINIFYNLPWLSYLLAAICGVLPDFIDAGYDKFKGKDSGSAHKYFLTHLPGMIIVFVLLPGIILSLVYEFPWFVVGLIWLAHLFHDLFEPMSHIVLFWPISKKTYHLYLSHFKLKQENLVVTPGWEEWAEKYYLIKTPESIAGRIIFTIGLILIGSDILFL